MYLDESNVTMKPGDVLVQRGTNHAWENCSDGHVKLAIILIDGKPKRTDSISGKGAPRYK